MKNILKLLAASCFLPFLLLGGLIAVVKTIIVATFGLAWQKGDDWHGYLIMKLNKYMQWLKDLI